MQTMNERQNSCEGDVQDGEEDISGVCDRELSRWIFKSYYKWQKRTTNQEWADYAIATTEQFVETMNADFDFTFLLGLEMSQ